MTPFIVLFCGLVLIFLEFYVPGAVLGTAGGLLVISSIFLAVITYDSPWVVGGFILLAAVLVSALIRFALWRIPRADPSSSIYSAGSQEGEGYHASAFDKSAIGKKGLVISDLKPGGYIEIEGKQHQALSESGYLQKGTSVIVVKGEGESLIVRED